MQFRYYIFRFGTGDQPSGTDDDLLAKRIAAEGSEDFWVVDSQTGTILDEEGEATIEVDAEDEDDWEDPPDDGSSADDEPGR